MPDQRDVGGLMSEGAELKGQLPTAALMRRRRRPPTETLLPPPPPPLPPPPAAGWEKDRTNSRCNGFYSFGSDSTELCGWEKSLIKCLC